MLSVNIEVINIITVSFTADVGFTEVHEPLWVLNSAPPPLYTRGPQHLVVNITLDLRRCR